MKIATALLKIKGKPRAVDKNPYKIEIKGPIITGALPELDSVADYVSKFESLNYENYDKPFEISEVSIVLDTLFSDFFRIYINVLFSGQDKYLLFSFTDEADEEILNITADLISVIETEHKTYHNLDIGRLLYRKLDFPFIEDERLRERYLEAWAAAENNLHFVFMSAWAQRLSKVYGKYKRLFEVLGLV